MSSAQQQTAQPNPQSQTPAEEAAERVAEATPGLAAAAAAVGLQDHRRALDAHARRVNDDHRMGLSALGFDNLAETMSDDAMGDILITGDIHASDPSQVVNALKGQGGQQQQPEPPPQPQAPPPQQPSQQPAQSNGSNGNLPKTLAALGLAAAGVGAGVGLPVAAYNLTKPSPAEFVDTDTDSNTRVRIYKGD